MVSVTSRHELLTSAIGFPTSYEWYILCAHAKWQYIAFCHRIMDNIPYSSKNTRTVNPYTYYIMHGRIHFLLSCCMLFFLCVLLWNATTYGACLRCPIRSLPRCTWTCPTMFSLFLVTTTILVMHVSRPSYRSPLPLCWRLHGRTCSCFIIAMHTCVYVKRSMQVSLPTW